MSGGRARGRRFGLGLIAIGVSLALFVVLVVVGLDPRPAATLGADGYSSSGLGHSALLRLLEELGVPVQQSRWSSAERAGGQDALVIAEPEPGLDAEGGRPSLGVGLDKVERVLVVAPKRLATAPAAERPRWMAGQEPLSLDAVQGVFSTWGLRLQRPPAGPEALDWEVPAGWPRPTLVAPAQLFAPDARLQPIVSCADGVLLGRLTRPQRRGGVLLLLADPDVLANHGLVEAENAAFALRVLDELRGDGRRLVWDETWHGHLARAHVGRLLLEPPLGYVTASLALLSLLALWAGAVRFGGLRPVRAALAPGKDFLVANTADLLRAGGHTGHVLRHYADAAEREAAERLHAGRTDANAARAALEALAQARGLAGPAALHAEIEALLARGRPDPRALVAAGERIHRWKEDLHHGRRRDS